MPSMFDPSTSSSNSALTFDAQAACVGLGGNAWTCFKKELPDSQIATRFVLSFCFWRYFRKEKFGKRD